MQRKGSTDTMKRAATVDLDDILGGAPHQSLISAAWPAITAPVRPAQSTRTRVRLVSSNHRSVKANALANGLRPQRVRALARRHRCARSAARRGEERALELVDGADGETEPDRIGLAAEGDLLHIALDMPSGVRTLPEKDYVTDAIARRRHALALQHDRPFEDHGGLVAIVVPVELALGAGPDQGRGSAVCASRQRTRAGFRITFKDPRWLDRRRLEVRIAMAGFNKRTRHRHFLPYPGNASCWFFPGSHGHTCRKQLEDATLGYP